MSSRGLFRQTFSGSSESSTLMSHHRSLAFILNHSSSIHLSFVIISYQPYVSSVIPFHSQPFFVMLGRFWLFHTIFCHSLSLPTNLHHFLSFLIISQLSWSFPIFPDHSPSFLIILHHSWSFSIIRDHSPSFVIILHLSFLHHSSSSTANIVTNVTITSSPSLSFLINHHHEDKLTKSLAFCLKAYKIKADTGSSIRIFSSTLPSLLLFQSFDLQNKRNKPLPIHSNRFKEPLAAFYFATCQEATTKSHTQKSNKSSPTGFILFSSPSATEHVSINDIFSKLPFSQPFNRIDRNDEDDRKQQ